jgi:hypothetical protein
MNNLIDAAPASQDDAAEGPQCAHVVERVAVYEQQVRPTPYRDRTEVVGATEKVSRIDGGDPEHFVGRQPGRRELGELVVDRASRRHDVDTRVGADQ